MQSALRVALASGVVLSGCAARSPSIPILGAYFPAWMICILVGAVLAALVRGVFGLARIDPTPRGLVYPALAVAFAIVTWLALYRG